MSTTTVKNTKKVDETIKRLSNLINGKDPVTPRTSAGLQRRIDNMDIEERNELDAKWLSLRTTGSEAEEKKYRTAFPEIQSYLREACKELVA